MKPFLRSIRLRHYYSHFPDLQRVHSIEESPSVAPAPYSNHCIRCISCRGFNDSSTALVFPSGTYLFDGRTIAAEVRGYGMDECPNDDSSHETTPFSSTSFHHHRRLMKLRNSNACTAILQCVKPRRRHRETFVESRKTQRFVPSIRSQRYLSTPGLCSTSIFSSIAPPCFPMVHDALERLSSRYSANLGKTRRVCIPQKCLGVNLVFALGNSATWPHFPSRHLHSTIYSQLRPAQTARIYSIKLVISSKFRSIFR